MNSDSMFSDSMFSINNKISIRQLQALLILDIFGTGVTILPRVVSDYAGQDGWICVVIATLLIAVAVYFITSLAKLFPNKTFYEYSAEILSKPIGIVISLALAAKILFGCAMNLRIFGEIVRQTMLNTTPFLIIFISMLLLAAYAAAKGYETRARIGELLIFIVLLPLIFVFGVAMQDIDFTNLMPVLSAPPQDIMRGSAAACFAFNGVELLLLVFPYINRPKNARKGSMHTVLLIGVMMTVVTIITIARFGPLNITSQLWPVLQMMDTVVIPGSIIEQQGALIMSFWIVSTFAAVNAGLFFSSLLLKDVIKKGRHSIYIGISIPIIAGLALLPGNLVQTYEYMTFVNYTFGIAFIFVIPFVMLIIAKIRGLGKGNA